MDKLVEQKILRHAWKYGHFRNPDYPGTHAVKESDIALLSMDDELSRQAIASVQVSDCQCDDFCHRHHGHGLNLDDDGKADGDPGPATIALVDIPRCRVPDFAMDDDEFGLAGRGGWSDCDPEREHHHEVVIKFDDRNAPPKWVGYMPQVKSDVVKLSAEMGLSLRYIDWDSDENYQSSVIFRFISGGVIGFYYLPQGSGCRRIPQGALDTSFLPNVRVAGGLWGHEGAGHGVGLGHRPARRISGILRGIMNPSIVDVPLSWVGDPSEGDMKRLYGGVSLDPEDLPPSSPDDEFKVVAEFAAESGQKFQVVTGKKGGGGWGEW